MCNLVDHAGLAQSVEHFTAVAGGCRLYSWEQTNTQDIKITEK